MTSAAASKLADLRRTAALNPDDADTLHALGEALTAAGEHSEAISVLESALRRDVNRGNTCDLLITVYSYAQENEAGLRFFADLARTSPTAVAVRYGVGRLYLETGRLDSAGGLLTSIAAALPQVAAFKYWLGSIAMCKGDFAQAEKLFNAFLAMKAPKDLTAECIGLAKDAEMLAVIRPALQNAPARTPRDAWDSEAAEKISRYMRGAPPAPLTAVFFHVDSTGQHPYLKGQPGAIDYKDTLLQACRAALTPNPATAIIIITDETSDLGPLNDIARCIRLPIPAGQMMYSRARANRALVASRIIAGPVLFLDTDIVLNRDFQPLFDGSFDVGLTYRPQPIWGAMPLNEGVILGADGSSEALLRFFDTVRDIYDALAASPAVARRYGFDVRNWRGGQLSLAALADWTVPPTRPETWVRDDVRYRFLPCATFNHAVQTTDRPAFLAKKWAIHFKGASAKERMADYAAYVAANRAPTAL